VSVRVLHLGAGNLYGGIERLLVTLARQSASWPGMEPHFALCFEGLLSKELSAAEAIIHWLGSVRVSRPWTVWRARDRLDALLRHRPFDVVVSHASWPHALFAPVVHARGLPLVFWAHSPHDGKHWLERWARRYPPQLMLANSRFTQSNLNLFSAMTSKVLHYPLQPPNSRAAPRLRRLVRAGLQTPDEALVVIQASRLERWKGQTLLLEALGRLKELSTWECWIVGGAQRPCDTAYLEELKARAAKQGISDRVRFLGQHTDISQFLAAADIFCQPNLAPEPFGIVFVEALYAGLPVVTAAMGGALEIVDDTCGILVPPDDAVALAATLRELMHKTSLRSRLSAAGPVRARALCAPATQMAKLQGLLDCAVSQAPKPDPARRETAE
jgi:glycosyltransferase involved in cell wall biosynthesis